VGYRYFDSARLPVLFPFGHGLSYTRFRYANLTLSSRQMGANEPLALSVEVTNVGSVAGAEVVQLYLKDLHCSVYRPEHELKAFAKVALAPGETQSVKLVLEASAFAFWDTVDGSWCVEPGEFEVRVGSSSRDIRLRERVVVDGAAAAPRSGAAGSGPGLVDGGLQVPDEAFSAMLGHPVPEAESARPFHLNSSLREIGQTWLGARFRTRFVDEFQRRMGAGSSDETLQKMFAEMADEMPLRALALFSRGRLTFGTLEIVVAILNRGYLRALRLWLDRANP
jgi:beta-glucosidase